MAFFVFSGVLMLSISHKKSDLDILVEAFNKTCKKISEIKNSKNQLKAI